MVFLFVVVEVLSSSILPLISLSILTSSVLNSVSGRLLVSILFSSVLEIYPVLSFGTCFLSHFGSFPVFVSMYQVALLCLPLLAEWPYRVGVLWVPVAQSPWSPEPGAPAVFLCGLCAFLL